MGRIVAAMSTAHAPQLFTRPPEEGPKQLDAGGAAMGRLGQSLDESKPDALIILASDHLGTFVLQSVPTLEVVVGENATAVFAGKTWAPKIHQGLAEGQLPHKNSDEPALDADPLVALGAHPVGSPVAVHVLQPGQRRMLRGAA